MLTTIPIATPVSPSSPPSASPDRSDHDLLAQIVGPSEKQGQAAARDILGGQTFRRLVSGARPPETAGLTRTQSRRLTALLELARRVEPDPRPPVLSDPRRVFDATADLRGQRREHFLGLYLNARHRLVCRETISVGSLNASIVHPREVFEPALRHGAASLVVVHNHPSGETDPSDDDLAITRRLVEAGEILGVPVVDHVIVGWGGFTSLREEGHL